MVINYINKEGQWSSKFTIAKAYNNGDGHEEKVNDEKSMSVRQTVFASPITNSLGFFLFL